MHKTEPLHKEISEIKNDDKEAPIIYTCSMQAEVILNKPGKCAKCGMELIEKK